MGAGDLLEKLAFIRAGFNRDITKRQMLFDSCFTFGSDRMKHAATISRYLLGLMFLQVVSKIGSASRQALTLEAV